MLKKASTKKVNRSFFAIFLILSVFITSLTACGRTEDLQEKDTAPDREFLSELLASATGREPLQDCVELAEKGGETFSEANAPENSSLAEAPAQNSEAQTSESAQGTERVPDNTPDETENKPIDNASKPTEHTVWIPTRGGKKYHSRSGCSGMKEPERVPLSRAKAMGFTSCKRCH